MQQPGMHTSARNTTNYFGREAASMRLQLAPEASELDGDT